MCITDGSEVCALCGEWMTGCNLCGQAPMVKGPSPEIDFMEDSEIAAQSASIKLAAAYRNGLLERPKVKNNETIDLSGRNRPF